VNAADHGAAVFTDRTRDAMLTDNRELRPHDLQPRGADDPAPWDISVTIVWGDEGAFDRQLAGADPLHAVELAAQFASKYIRGRAEDEGGTLEPPIAP
jgi:hypothetical protein